MTELVDLPLSKLVPADDNLRSGPATADAEMVASIRSLGILEPLLVQPVEGNGHYRVVAGHRRLDGARQAKFKTVPCVVRDFTEAERVEAMLVENLRRTDISPFDEATGFTRLLELGMTKKELAAKVGRPQAYVTERLRLLVLPDTARQAVLDGTLTVGLAARLAKLSPTDATVAKVVGSYDAEREVVALERKAEAEAERAKVARECDKRGLEWAKKAPSGARPLSGYGGLGLDPDQAAAHEAEPCHLVVIGISPGGYYEGARPHCVDPDRHRPAPAADDGDDQAETPASPIVVTDTPTTSEWEQRRAEVAAQNQARVEHRREFMRQALAQKMTAEQTRVLLWSLLTITPNNASRIAELVGLDDPSEDAVRQYAAANMANMTRVGWASLLANYLWPHEMGWWRREDRYEDRLDFFGYEPAEEEAAERAAAAAERAVLDEAVGRLRELLVARGWDAAHDEFESVLVSIDDNLELLMDDGMTVAEAEAELTAEITDGVYGPWAFDALGTDPNEDE